MGDEQVQRTSTLDLPALTEAGSVVLSGVPRYGAITTDMLCLAAARMPASMNGAPLPCRPGSSVAYWASQHAAESSGCPGGHAGRPVLHVTAFVSQTDAGSSGPSGRV